MDVDAFRGTCSDVSEFHRTRATEQSNNAKSKPARSRAELPLPRHARGERFIRGPIPLQWMKLASKCGNRSEAVALLLWYAAGFQRSNPVKLSKKTLAELAIHPKTAKRVLVRMMEFKLVDAEFRRGCSPLVTIRDPNELD